MSDILTVTRGDILVEEWKLSADKAIAGATVQAMFRRAVDRPPIITASMGSGWTIVSDVAGNRTLRLTLTGAQTSNGIDLKGEELIFDAQLIYSDNDGPHTFVRDARLIIEREVTR